MKITVKSVRSDRKDLQISFDVDPDSSVLAVKQAVAKSALFENVSSFHF